ncbi:MAG: PorT family protein, partial [Flavobacteriales bacterium]|nr:PorT family protein [Flavobacteriales bacterium]
MKYLKIIHLALVVLFGSQVFAQSQTPKNLETFDYKRIHFGFLLSVNKSDFDITYNPDFTFEDSLLSLQNVPQSGFNLALLASFNATKNIRFRFIPGLSFQDRGLNYRFLDNEGTTELFLKRTESVYLDFPLMLKLRTNRVGNFAAYGLIGAKYSIDMQSQKDVNNANESDKIIKLIDKDYSIDAGGGIDLFLPYFKFGIEVKSAIGFPNVLIQEDTRFSSPIE